MNTHIFLHKGYFWSAGEKYGWSKTDPGVGIAVSKIKDALPNGRIYVKSTYDYLSISSKTAVQEIKKHKSIMTIGNKKIAVIPKSRFRKEISSKEERLLNQLEADHKLPLFNKET